MRKDKDGESAPLPRDSLLVVASGSCAACNLHGLSTLLSERFRLPIKIVLTRSALRFVTIDTLQHVGEANAVITDDSLPQTSRPNHVWLADSARAVIVYPASAGFIGKMANGLALDVASTTVLAAFGLPMLIVPSMNAGMWMNPFVQANLRRLAEAKISVQETANGMAPPVDVVVERVNELLRDSTRLQVAN